jgi:transcriptional regulator with XRE-family HTH domain
MPRGRQPDFKRRQQITDLRAAGLSLDRIAHQLGITRQRVQFVLKLTDRLLAPVRCQDCDTRITELRGVSAHNRAVWCLGCLSKHPKATFGQRLKAHRLAAGLSLAVLERRSGVDRALLKEYECDRSEPKWRSLVKLIRVLGVEWLAVE